MKALKTIFITIPFVLSATGAIAQTSVRDSSANTQNDNNKAKNTNTIVGALNMGLSATYFAQCPPTNYGACVQGAIYLLLGMLNQKQASANGDTASAAGGTLGATDVGIGGYDPTAVNALARDPEVMSGTAFGNSMTNADPTKGMSYDPKTNSVTLLDGKVIKGSDVGSPDAMAAAGMSKDVIDGVIANQKKFEDQALKKLDKYGLNKMAVNGEEAGGGGGGGGSHGSGSGGDVNGLAGGARAAKLGIDRDPAQVAGMQKDYNGEPIGVAGDSIFRMMTRRYKVKESQSTFLDESALLQK